MDKKLRITDDNWTYGSYHRIHYKKDMLYTFFQYVDIHFTWNVGMGTYSLQDHLVDRLRKKGLISDAQAHSYHETALQFLSQMSAYDEWPIENIYGQVRRIRRNMLGAEVLEQDRRQQMAEGCVFALEDGIDQTAKKESILHEKEAVIFALCQPEYFSLMKQDMETAQSHGHRVYVLVSKEQGACLPSREVLESMLGDPVVYLAMEDESLGLRLDQITYDDLLQSAIDQDHGALLVYGEEGLLHCRNLQVEAMVQTMPFGYHARAMVGQLDGGRASVVYVPKHFDITRWVQMTEKTKLSYWQLWQLWKDHGDGIYAKSVGQLYRDHPQYFLNVYENGVVCPEVAARYPIQVKWPQEDIQAQGYIWSEAEATIARYYKLRDQAIAKVIQSQPGLTYLSTYFTKEMTESSIPWQEEGQQSGILVHGIRMASSQKAKVINCDTGMTLRQQLAAEASIGKVSLARPEGQKKGTETLQMLSNFLFFLTPKLAELYNKLREDRPREQLQEKQGHLDYQLCWKDGRRVESFPLYQKAVLAKKRDGRFLLCQYGLGGGTVKVAGKQGVEVTLSWEASAVNICEDVEGNVHRILVYTPYLSLGDEGEGMFANSYRCMVGEGRVNLVVIQDKIQCIRQGDVVLPGIGVVISLEKEMGRHFLEDLRLVTDEDGYADISDLALTVELDGPSQIDDHEWQQVEWAYGGGLSLITNGQSIYEGDDMEERQKGMQEATGMARLTEEGWLSPLSRQTQESALHVLIKHPRTAIGIAKNGDLFVLVFSGRTRMSTGADYQEMCHIAKQLIPDVEAMMNVDGGGSSVLGLAIDGHFMELSYPATSMSSCAGMVRKVNTVLCLEP